MQVKDKMARKVVFVFPRVLYQSGDPPLGLASLAAVLRQEHKELEVQIIDGTFIGGLNKLLEAVYAAQADIVGVFVDSLMAKESLEVARVAKRSKAFTIAGGPFATVAPEFLSGEFDAVFQGEGESNLAEVVRAILDRTSLAQIPGIYNQDQEQPDGNQIPSLVKDLDSLPFPAWDLLDMERYLKLWPYLDSTGTSLIGTNVVASRGCPWNCTYCQPTLSKIFGRKIRRYSPGRVVAEVRELQRLYKVDGIFFHDDTMTANSKWLGELCDELARLPKPILWGCNSRVDSLAPELIDTMAEAGLRTVHLGIEAGSERIRRDILDKQVNINHLEKVLTHLNRRDVHPLGFFMLGSPTETVLEMFQTIFLARRLDLMEATFSITSALQGSRLHSQLLENKRFSLDERGQLDYYRRRNFVDFESQVGNGTLRGIQLLGLAAFYVHPKRLRYIGKHLTSIGGITKLAMKASRFLKPG